MIWTRNNRSFVAAMALITMLAGCASFTPPQYDGEISKIEGPIELKPAVTGKFTFSETSLTTTSVVVRMFAGMSMTGTSKVRTEASAQSSVKPAGKGYVMAMMFDRISARPVGGKAESEGKSFKVKDLGYTGFLDGDGKMVAFDVDVMSEGWLSMDAEYKQMVEAELDNWKKRRKREPVLPERIGPDDVIEVDVSDLYDTNSDELPADFKSTGKAIYSMAGITTYRDRTHLVLNIQGTIEGSSRKEKMTVTGEMGGFLLIDIANGDPAHWEHSVRVKVAVPDATVTIREESEGDLTRR